SFLRRGSDFPEGGGSGFPEPAHTVGARPSRRPPRSPTRRARSHTNRARPSRRRPRSPTRRACLHTDRAPASRRQPWSPTPRSRLHTDRARPSRRRQRLHTLRTRLHTNRGLWRWALPESRAVSAYLRTLPFGLDAWTDVTREGVGSVATWGRAIVSLRRRLRPAAGCPPARSARGPSRAPRSRH